ncbi:MAG TPA: FliG C-terminal domain-containing protein [Elusimicrobiales bacterium]|nr:FliG C-terminal domain-containing protein [Elusimicrobiales bacterium]
MKAVLNEFRSGLRAAAAVAALLCASTAALPAYGQTANTPLDDKARYERSLEMKVEEVLLKMIGPSQAKVVVEATMDFTRTEKVDMTTSQDASAAKEGAFKWDGASAENQIVSEYLLPGFPSMPSGSGKPENTTYQKQMLFPTSFLKKLVVTVILNKDISNSDAESVRKVVAEVLALDQKRGDDLIIIKAPFAPFWRTIWYTPEAMGMIFKYGILAIMGIIALVVVAIGFLKLAGAMSTMAKAQQSHQITMDVGKELGGAQGSSGSENDPLRLAGGVSLGVERKEGESGPGTDGEPEKIIFNVKPDQVMFLVHLMGNEDPANIALVVAHLTMDVRSEFLKQLPPEISSDVLSHMAKVRFVEPDVINTIKEELERRLSGTEGGVHQVIEIMEKVNLRAKREMLEKLVQKDPETAQLVRRKILLPEDIGRLSERDLSILIADFKIETLAMALWDLPPSLKGLIQKQMAAKTWQMVEQTMKYGAPSRENAERAVEELVEQTLKLIKEGRISDPLSSGPAMLSEPAAAPPPVPAEAPASVPAPPEPPRPPSMPRG